MSEAKVNLPEKVEADMLRVRKDSTGAINAKRLGAIFENLEGYEIENVLEFVDVDRLDMDRAMNMADIEVNGILYYEKGSEYIPEGLYGYRDASIEKLEAIREKLEALPEPVGKPKAKKVYVANIGEISPAGETYDWDKGEDVPAFILPVDIMVGAKGLKVTTPDGEFTEHLKVGYNKITMWDIWKFLNETSFKNDVLAVLGMEEHIPAAERTRENTATCAICGKNHKMEADGTMVRHGYKLRPYGGTEGMCFGRGHLPYEVSTAAIEAYLPKLNGWKEAAEKKMEMLKSGEVDKLTSRFGNDVKKGDDGWDYALANAIRAVESEITYITRDIEMYEKRIENWVPRHYPEVGSFGMGKPK